MINCMLWLNESRYDPDLPATLSGMNICCIRDIFSDTEDLIHCFEMLRKRAHVLVIADSVLGDCDRQMLLSKVRAYEPDIRIIPVLPGCRHEYCSQQIENIKKTWDVSELVFEGVKIDGKYLGEVIRHSMIPVKVVSTPEKGRLIYQPFKVSVVGLTSGSGVTTMTKNIAEAIARHKGCSVMGCEWSNHGSFSFLKSPNVVYCNESKRQNYEQVFDTVVHDCSTPLLLSPKGEIISQLIPYSKTYYANIVTSDIKIAMCTADVWNAEKVKVFFDESFTDQVGDDKWIVVFDRDSERKGSFSGFPIFRRDDPELIKTIIEAHDEFTAQIENARRNLKRKL